MSTHKLQVQKSHESFGRRTEVLKVCTRPSVSNRPIPSIDLVMLLATKPEEMVECFAKAEPSASWKFKFGKNQVENVNVHLQRQEPQLKHI